MRKRRWRRWAAVVVAGLLALPGLIFGFAYLFKDHSGIARAIIWMDADTGDQRRFLARPIEAPQRATPLERAPIDLDHERVGTQTSFSVAKSFASALVGIAVEEGAIGDIDDPITRYLPELLERDRRFEQITIAHLISMTSGLRYEESGTPWGDDAQTYYGTDLRDLALSDTEIVEAPGTRWHYNNYNPLLLGMILERATGVPVAEYLERKLWKPLGAEFDASWSLDSEDSGFEKMESGINARAIDFARLGVLYLHDGRWLGRQIVPRSWIRASTSAASVAYHYGYWWWVEPGGAFVARGNLGQFVFVDPRRDVVIARFGDDDGGVYWSSLFEQVASLAVTERS